MRDASRFSFGTSVIIKTSEDSANELKHIQKHALQNNDLKIANFRAKSDHERLKDTDEVGKSLYSALIIANSDLS